MVSDTMIQVFWVKIVFLMIRLEFIQLNLEILSLIREKCCIWCYWEVSAGV